jgi:hypothetical protein
MRLLLTSFGIGRTSAVRLRERSLFDRMPPVSFRLLNSAFMPDYELLVLCDQIVMDESSFQQLIDSSFPAYAGVAKTFRALKAEGRIELVDFSSVLRANTDLLDKMLEQDMKVLDQWVVPLRESVTIWRDFAKRAVQVWGDGLTQRTIIGGALDAGLETRGYASLFGHVGPVFLNDDAGETIKLSDIVEVALRSAEKRRRKEYRGALQGVINAYLSYVNANLVLASEFGIPFHDWLDFMPFYSTKFLSVGKREGEAQQKRKQVERLFTLAFPELAIQDTRALLKVLNDKRVQDLRKLIGDAVLGKVQFDERFAKSVLADVLQSERRATRCRTIVGYLTLPIGFAPLIGTPAQKVAEETVGALVDKKMKQKHQWFYMLSDIADSRGEKANQGE